ncbi:HAD family hydrolase [Williamsia phyllosphaerae]|uniref:Haloacid dehalogenase n=1 Tax=Williamsia phyllosphaerae TaxID=885042 RepID=A0ABQ1URJ3_9NOCA|nr:HAD family phosphatase [Williamsia phyllosphaerae]GGF23649.1 haloacid dehalogenase [Williamsia phyllosphaerae]
MGLPQRLSAIVFDCDGLLLDTETCWSRAEAALFADNGFGFGPTEKDLLIGRSVPAACENMARYFGRPDDGAKLAADLLARVESELARGVDPMPGARDLLDALGGRVPIAVATNSPRAMLTAALGSSGFDRYFETSVTADEVDHPKPHPELYLVAFATLGADPTGGVALEDSATGVAAAKASGAFLITVPSQPGKTLGGDFVTTSLADPEIVTWASNVEATQGHPP